MVLLADTIACRLWKNKIVLAALMMLSVLSCKQTNKATAKGNIAFLQFRRF